MPAAALLEMALGAARARYPAAAALEVVDFEIMRPFPIEVGQMREARVRLAATDASGAIEIASRQRLSDDPWTIHATGRVLAGSSAQPARPVPAPIADGETMAGDRLRRDAAELGLVYGPAFHTVQDVRIALDAAAIDVRLKVAGDGVDGMLLPPPLLDGAFQGLVGLAARVLSAGDGVVPWRFGRVRLLRPGGTIPTSARLRLRRVGPRSVCADLVLLDAQDEPVAEALDCWFVRVPLRGGGAGLVQAAFHSDQVASSIDGDPAEAASLLRAALETCVPVAVQEASLLADAFASSVAEETLRGLLVAPEQPLNKTELLARGRVGFAGLPLGHVRQHGGNCGVIEVAKGQAARVDN